MDGFRSLVSMGQSSEDRLSKLLCPPGVDCYSQPLEDAHFDQIAAEMEAQAWPKSWTSRPRTYFILVQIKKVKTMDIFVNQGYDDTDIPYANKNAFPTSSSQLFNPFEADDFLKWQRVCVSERLQLEAGVHCRLDDGDVLFEDHKPKLGHGSEMRTVVDKVTSKATGRVYARKRITRKKLPKEAQKAFSKELRALTKIGEHEHLIRVCGTYTDKKYLALLLEPVADCTLKQFLVSPQGRVEDRKILWTFFGCMAKVTSYLHDLAILHKDIKLENFLLKDGRLILTDFGTAFDFSETGQSMTRSNSEDARTARYCSPEVIKEGEFRRASDIWSLGVVYLEMATVLHGKSLRDFDLHMASYGKKTTQIHANRDVALNWFQDLRAQRCPPPDSEPLAWIQTMLEITPTSRPKAADLWHTISSAQSARFCGPCCCDQLSDPESESDLLSSDEDEGFHLESKPQQCSGTAWNSGVTLSGTNSRPAVPSQRFHTPSGEEALRAIPGAFPLDSIVYDRFQDLLITTTPNTPMFQSPLPGPVYPIQQPDQTEGERAERQKWFQNPTSPGRQNIQDIQRPSAATSAHKTAIQHSRTAQSQPEAVQLDWRVLPLVRAAPKPDRLYGEQENLTSLIQRPDPNAARILTVVPLAQRLPPSRPVLKSETIVGGPQQISVKQTVPLSNKQNALTRATAPLAVVNVNVQRERTQKNPSVIRHRTIDRRKRSGFDSQVGDEPISAVTVQQQRLKHFLTSLPSGQGYDKIVEHHQDQFSWTEPKERTSLRHVVEVQSQEDLLRATGQDEGGTEDETDNAQAPGLERPKLVRYPSDGNLREEYESPDERPRIIEELKRFSKHFMLPRFLQRKPEVQLETPLTETPQPDTRVATNSLTAGVVAAEAKPNVESGAKTTVAAAADTAVAAAHAAISTTGPLEAPAGRCPVSSPAAPQHLVEAAQPSSQEKDSEAEDSRAELVVRRPSLQIPPTLSIGPQRAVQTDITQYHATIEDEQEDEAREPKDPEEPQASERSSEPKGIKKLKRPKEVKFATAMPQVKPLGEYLAVVPARNEFGRDWESATAIMQRILDDKASVAPTSVMSVNTRKLLSGGRPVMRWNDKTYGYLPYFVSQGKVAAVRELLAGGCNPGREDKPRWLPILRAIQGRTDAHNKCLLSLIENGGNAKARHSSNGKTYLHYALSQEVWSGYSTTVYILLIAGTDPNVTDSTGNTAVTSLLIGAGPLRSEERDTLMLMLAPNFNTKMDVRDANLSENVFHLAIRRRDPYALDAVLTATRNEHLKKEMLKERNASGFTPLLLIMNICVFNVEESAANATRMMDLVLENGANPDDKDLTTKDRLLHSVVGFHKSTEALELLIKHGADPSYCNAKGISARKLLHDRAKENPHDVWYAQTLARVSKLKVWKLGF